MAIKHIIADRRLLNDKPANRSGIKIAPNLVAVFLSRMDCYSSSKLDR